MLGEILRGAAEKAAEAGIAIVGGHTIRAEEPIFGLAVIGTVHPKRMITNSGALTGDFLILTKPIGLGIITTAAKNGEDSQGKRSPEATRLMATLNKAAATVFGESEGAVHALTDVTTALACWGIYARQRVDRQFRGGRNLARLRADAHGRA